MVGRKAAVGVGCGTQEYDVDDSFHDTGSQSTKKFLWLHEVRRYIGLAHALHVCHVG
jgi:hypothetical protein